MPLSLTSEFTANDIHTIKMYKAGTVYLLKGNGDDLVVKQESGIYQDSGAKHFDLSKKAMGSVDKNVKASKKLSQNELNAMVQFVQRQKTLVQLRLKDQLAGATSDLDETLNTLRDSTRKNLWYKMPSLQMTDMQSALEAQMGKTQAGFNKPETDIPQSSKLMSDFLKALKASGGIESLGQVVAIDMFSGNDDRFLPDGGGKKTVGDYEQRFRTIVNLGNLMIVGGGKAKTITGMDFADPQSVMMEVDKSLQQQTGGKWRGLVIANGPERKKFAKDIIFDLESLFRAGRKKGLKDFLPGGALGSNAAKRLENGMVSGAGTLTKMAREKMRTKLKVYPPSFLERIEIYEQLY